jgi:hypothetical protein
MGGSWTRASRPSPPPASLASLLTGTWLEPRLRVAVLPRRHSGAANAVGTTRPTVAPMRSEATILLTRFKAVSPPLTPDPKPPSDCYSNGRHGESLWGVGIARRREQTRSSKRQAHSYSIDDR